MTSPLFFPHTQGPVNDTFLSVSDGPGKQKSGVGEDRIEEGGTSYRGVEEGTACIGVQMKENALYQPSTNLILATNPAYWTSFSMAIASKIQSAEDNFAYASSIGST